MKLFICMFESESYSVVVKAETFDQAKEKTIKYIKENHQWYDIKKVDIDLVIISCDEDYIIE